MTDCASMVESVRVQRRGWLGVDHSAIRRRHPVGLVQFKIIWTMAAGFEREDALMYDALQLLKLPVGAVPMMSPIYTLPYEGHPGACTVGIAYLIRTADDVVARICLRPNAHAVDPDDTFMIDPLKEFGTNIFPLPIEDVCDA